MIHKAPKRSAKFKFARPTKEICVSKCLGVMLLYYVYTNCFIGLVEALQEYHVEAICCDVDQEAIESHFNNSCIRVESCFDTVSYNVDGGNIKVNCTFGGLFFCNDDDTLRGCTLVLNPAPQLPVYDECLRLFHKQYEFRIPKDKLDCLSALCEKYKYSSICSAQVHNVTHILQTNDLLGRFTNCTKAEENGTAWKTSTIVLLIILFIVVGAFIWILLIFMKRRGRKPKNSEESSVGTINSKNSIGAKSDDTVEGGIRLIPENKSVELVG